MQENILLSERSAGAENSGCIILAEAMACNSPAQNDQQDLNEPSASADGKYIYYSEDVSPGGPFI